MKRGLLYIFLCISIIAYPQKTNKAVRGYVLEETEKGELKPLPFANIVWNNSNIGTLSDSTGYFELPYDNSNNRLIITYVGFKPDTVTIEKRAELTIILRKNIDIDAVKIVHRTKSTEISYINPIYLKNINEDELLKAACCNLSESFETNPSVDVSFTDAITGTRQIKMLGLAGKYTYISRENMPDLRNVSTMYGLTYTPGPWIESIQLSKGAGTVVNGYESIAGQINVEFKKSNDEELGHVSLFGNQEGRSEFNLIVSPWISPRLKTDIYIHANAKPWKMDNNKDGFMDFPTGDQINFANRWQYRNQKGFSTQIAFRYLKDNKLGGQTNYNPEDAVNRLNNWGMELETTRKELWGKAGYVFPNHKYNSVGFQWKILDYEMLGNYGRQLYASREESKYANLIFQTIIKNTNNKIRTGISFYDDKIFEFYDLNSFKLSETVLGGFAEYSFDYFEKFNLIAGLRADYSTEYNFFITPRLHARYAIFDKTVLRVSAGSGQRTTWLFSENMGLMASSRNFILTPVNTNIPVDRREKAINYGISLSQHFKMGYRTGTFLVDFYRTDFLNQVVTDIETPGSVYFYNLNGKSYSNSFQTQLDYELIPRLDIRLAYRWYDVKTNYNENLLQVPLIAQHRAFINAAYESRKRWKYDITAQWLGKKRLPGTASNPVEYQLGEYSPSFVLINSQIAKQFRNKMEVYVGVENLSNYKQENPIISSDNPFGNYFDASIIYAPIFGRMFYGGFRWDIKRFKEL